MDAIIKDLHEMTCLPSFTVNIKCKLRLTHLRFIS